MTPKSEAIAFRAWQYASRLGWDCTIGEVAEALDVSPISLGKIMQHKGWATRFRDGGVAREYHEALRGKGASGLTVEAAAIAHDLRRDIARGATL